MAETETDLPLARVIEGLRRELLKAVLLGANQPLRFRLKPVEVELQVVVTNTGEGEAGIRFWVVNLGAKASTANQVTHSLKLTLDPVYRGGDEEILVSDFESGPVTPPKK